MANKSFKEQFYQHMMSKFHKTTYPRQHNFNVISSSQGKRNPLYQQPNSDWINHPKVDIPLERKIDIESSLLFPQKKYPKPATKPVELPQRKTINKSQAKFYQTSTGFTQARDRPQSKQEPRMKGIIEGKLKTEALQHQRPQTSKGERKIKANISEIRERQTSENDEEFPVQIKITQKKARTVQSSFSKRPSHPDNYLPFNTSIDPEFLSLFAS